MEKTMIRSSTWRIRHTRMMLRRGSNIRRTRRKVVGNSSNNIIMNTLSSRSSMINRSNKRWMWCSWTWRMMRMTYSRMTVMWGSVGSTTGRCQSSRSSSRRTRCRTYNKRWRSGSRYTTWSNRSSSIWSFDCSRNSSSRSCRGKMSSCISIRTNNRRMMSSNNTPWNSSSRRCW